MWVNRATLVVGRAASGLPRSTDIVRPPRHVGLVPHSEVRNGRQFIQLKKPRVKGDPHDAAAAVCSSTPGS
jgi:hypothetical protein